MVRIKPLFLLLAGLVADSSAQVQGTVNFSNGAAGVNAPISDGFGSGTFLSGSAYKADLWYGPAGIAPCDLYNLNLQSLGLAVNFATGPAAGYFFGGSQTIPGFAVGSIASLQVRIWRAADGATYLSAVANPGGHFGESQVIQSPPLGGGVIPTPNMIGLQSFPFPLSLQPWCVPEPSTSALVIFGAAGLFLFRRRTGQSMRT